MPGPEAAIERKCRDLVEVHGDELFKVKFAGRVGFPDRLLVVCFGGSRRRFARHILCEFKRPGEVPSKNQVAVHNELRQAGMEVWVIDNFDTFERRYNASRK